MSTVTLSFVSCVTTRDSRLHCHGYLLYAINCMCHLYCNQITKTFLLFLLFLYIGNADFAVIEEYDILN
jgi:hypothetical protein